MMCCLLIKTRADDTLSVLKKKSINKVHGLGLFQACLGV